MNNYIVGKSRVVTAGERLRKNKATEEDLNIINYWRSEHNAVLSNFKNILTRRIENFKGNIIFGQRLKRLVTITDKVQNRHSGMKITRMQDIAGCRLIFDSIADLRRFEKKLNISQHELFKVEDRIETPKRTGYRSVHYIYKYNPEDKSDGSLAKTLEIHKGMLIEVQLRTRYQHHWATAVEVFDQIDNKKVKFTTNPSSSEIAIFFKYSAEMIARAHGEPDKIEISNFLLMWKVFKLTIKTNIIKIFDKVYLIRKYSDKIYSKNAIIRIPFNRSKPEIYCSDDPHSTMMHYFKLEKDYPEDNIVYVLGFDDQIKECFKNYFFDSSDFMDDIYYSFRKLTSRSLEKSNILVKLIVIFILIIVALISLLLIWLRRSSMMVSYSLKHYIIKKIIKN